MMILKILFLTIHCSILYSSQTKHIYRPHNIYDPHIIYGAYKSIRKEFKSYFNNRTSAANDPKSNKDFIENLVRAMINTEISALESRINQDRYFENQSDAEIAQLTAIRTNILNQKIKELAKLFKKLENNSELHTIHRKRRINSLKKKH